MCSPNSENSIIFGTASSVTFFPKPKIEVTEHQALEKKCPCCGELTRGVFPEHIRGPVQYGERVQALTAYFAHQLLYLLTAYARSLRMFLALPFRQAPVPMLTKGFFDSSNHLKAVLKHICW